MSMLTVSEEIKWLKDHPEFHERPATVLEFVGADYLNIEKHVRKRVMQELRAIMGDKPRSDKPTRVPEALITGGIGIGKTTIASIVLPYLCHWMLCLKNPQDFFDLMPGSRIAFMQMSTSEKQAREVIFQDIKARIQNSAWFKKYPPDPSFTNQIRFEKDIWIIPGDSKDTTFEGYNIFGGILDEADSHMVTEDKDYAENGFNTISNRISSRFQDRGFLLIIGQMKSSTGFVARKFEEMFKREKDEAYAVRLAIWDSMGEDFYRNLHPKGEYDCFYYDPRRKRVIPESIATLVGGEDILLRIPMMYHQQFKNNPEKALKDLAGMPTAVNDPFISLVHKIDACRDRWIESHDNLPSPVSPEGTIAKWFHARDTLPRTCHIDMAYSAKGDALGFAMGHVSKTIDRDGELKPYIIIDMLMRVKARPGSQIFLGDVRNMVYSLREDFNFKLSKITMDGFESTDSLQQFQRKRFETEMVSVDKEKLPYHDLREAIYEDRIEFPPYIVQITNDSGTKQVEILVKELMELMDTGRKIDHPVNGSKDIADAVAGVTFTLMGDRKFRRKVISLAPYREQAQQKQAVNSYSHPAFREQFGIQAPLPPSQPWRN